MNLRESAGMALSALRANKLRSFLTLLGTIIGVMSVIAVLSFVEGLNRFVSEKLLASGSNVFYVDKYGFITSQEEFEAVRDRPDVTIDDADALREGVSHARLVIAQGNDQVVARYKNKTVKGVTLRGRSAGFETVDDYTIGSGRFYGVWFVRTDTGDKAFLGALAQDESIILSRGGRGKVEFAATQFTTGPNAGSPIRFGPAGTNLVIVLIENKINGLTPSPVGPVPGAGVALSGTF